MVARVAGLAAGSSADLWVLRLMTRLRARSATASAGSTARRGPRRHVRVTLLVALPLSFALRGHDRGAPRREPGGRSGGAGTNYDWWQEFSAQAAGPRHHVRAVDHRLRRRARQPQRAPRQPAAGRDDRRRDRGLAGAVVVPVRRLLDRFARRRPTRAHGFFAACGIHFWRFLRLGVVAWLYCFLFRGVHALDFRRRSIRGLTRDVTVERTAFAADPLLPDLRLAAGA